MEIQTIGDLQAYIRNLDPNLELWNVDGERPHFTLDTDPDDGVAYILVSDRHEADRN